MTIFASISNQNNYTNTKIQEVFLILVTYVMTDNYRLCPKYIRYFVSQRARRAKLYRLLL